MRPILLRADEGPLDVDAEDVGAHIPCSLSWLDVGEDSVILLETNLESDFLVLVQDDLTSFSTSRTVFENHQKRSHLNFSTKLIFLLATLVLAMFKNETFKVIFNNCDWTILWQL